MKPRLDAHYFSAVDAQIQELLKCMPVDQRRFFQAHVDRYDYERATRYLERMWPAAGSIAYSELSGILSMAAEYAKSVLVARIAVHNLVREHVDEWNKLMESGGGPAYVGKVRRKHDRDVGRQ